MNETDPKRYRIQLEPDLRTFRFSGLTEIILDAPEPVNEVSLNAADLAVWSCKVEWNGEGKQCPFSVDPERELLIVSLPKEMTGTIRLKISYIGEINERLAGLYRSRYLHEGKERYAAVTQLEESDARRVFPCFDHPLKKAVFDIEVVIDENLTAISNGPVLEEKIEGGGRKRVRFQSTPKMSTYLLFIGVGEFEFIEDPGKVLVRAATMPGLTKYAGFGLDFGRKSLAFSEQYYDIPYPLPKLDLIAVPDFAAGAMENWGAITFRENLLLHYPGVTSKAGEARICEVIAHEIAHQWFGNLVSPSDWQYLWLNESFATYFAYGTVDHYHPEWEVWQQFLSFTTDVALERDSLKENVPIEIPGGEHLVINVSTAPIIYSKGGSILRQVEGTIGSEIFQAGLRHYLKKHEYACASSREFWEAFDETSTIPVTRMMRSWIEQPGHPVLEVDREGDRLRIRQQRFTYLPNAFEQTWIIPLSVEVFLKNGRTRTIRELMETETTTLDLGPDALYYKINAEQTGFYRVDYQDKANLLGLRDPVSRKVLGPEDRWGLENDLYALVKAGRVGMEDYLEFLAAYQEEDAYLPLTSIAGNLSHAYLVTAGEIRNRIAGRAITLFENVLSRLGYEPQSDEKLTDSILRDSLIWQAALFGSERANEFAMDQFSGLLAGTRRVHADIVKGIMQVGALNGSGDTFEWFSRRFSEAESEHERMNILAALGCFRDPDLVRRVQQYILDQVPARNKFLPVGAMARNPYAAPLLWEWYVSRLDDLERLHPMHYERVVAAVVPYGGLGKEGDVNAFFEDYVKKNEKMRDVIRLSLERLEINSGMGR